MNRLTKCVKIALAAFFIAALPTTAFAEPERVPNPSRVSSVSAMSPKAIAGFKKAFGNRMDDPNTVSAMPTSTVAKRLVANRPKSILKAPESPEGNIYALVPYHAQSASYNDGYFAHLNLNNITLEREFTNASLCNGSDYYFQSGAERKGVLYTPYYTENMITGEIRVFWKAFDSETGNRLPDIEFAATDTSLQAFFYGMTYDPIHDLFYGLSLDLATYQFGNLVVVDPKQAVWTPKPVGFLGNAVGSSTCCIAYNPVDQMLYGLTDGGELMMIDVESDVFDYFPVNTYDDFNDYFMFPTEHTANAFCYSPYDHAFLFVYRDSFQQKMILASIDAETYAAYELGEITPLGYISALICRDAYAPDNAPDTMLAPSVAFDKANVEGTYTIHTPATTFGGVALTQDILVHIVLDGMEVDSFLGKPDTEYTRSLSTTTGQHTLDVYSSIGDDNSPVATLTFYAGYDSTLPPTGLKLDRNVLSWTAPSDQGAHNGYVDYDDLTYNVYFNGVKVNTDPIVDTKYEFAQPEEMDRKAITVTSVTREVESQPSLPLSRTVGVALELPFSLQPSNASEASLFETYNADGDGNEFEYYTRWDGFDCYTIRTARYTEAPDDWLFLPALSLDDPEALYELTFKYANAYLSELHMDNMEIFIGSNPTPAAMKQKIYSHTERNTPAVTEVKAGFAVPTADDYVIGIHSYPGNSTQYRGVLLYDFDVRKSATATAEAPTAPTDVKVTPADYGDLMVDFDFTAPTTGLNGKALASDTDITVTATSSAGTASTTVKPGEKGHVSVAAAIDGFNEFYLVPSSAAGEGPSSYYRLYVGIDTPVAPKVTGYTIDRDNLGFQFAWETPTEGSHGAYIDPSALTYAVFSQGSAGNYTKIADVNGLEYHFTVDPGNQAFYHVGPVASNEIGSSVNGVFVYESLGTPYPTPMIEEWNNAAFSYSKWTFSTQNEYSQIDVQSISGLGGLGVGDGVFARGGGLAIINTNPRMSSPYQLIAPRFATTGLAKVKVGVRVWDYERSGNIQLWAQCADDQEYKFIGELEMPHDRGQWLDLEMPLPEAYSDQPWVQVNLRGEIPGDQYVILDNYSAMQDIDTDFTVKSIDGPSMTTVGETAKFDIVLANSGNEPATTTLIVDILGDGQVLATDTKEVGRTLSGENYEYSASFPVGVKFLGYDKLEARATVSHPTDQNSNNNVMSMEFVVNDHALPVVGDLEASRDGQDVVLTWSAPNTSYGSPESFEVMEPFSSAEKLGLWKNIDGDGKVPFAIDGGMRFDGDDQPCAWVVWDSERMHSTTDPRLCAHSGRNTLLARSIGYAESDTPTRSFDWLISPEIEPGSSVSFWYNTLSSQYTETIELWISYTDDQIDLDNIQYNSAGNPVKCGSFYKLRNFTKSGSETWEFCESGPLKNVKYFALVYGSIGQFGAMLDDIIFTPANDYNWDIESYQIARQIGNGPVNIIAKDIKDLTFRETNDALHSTYWVRTVVNSDGRDYFSPLSNEVRIEGSSVGQLAAGSSVEGGHGCVVLSGLNGQTADLYDAEGRHLTKVSLRSDRQEVSAPVGVVLVKVGDAYTKVLVK